MSPLLAHTEAFIAHNGIYYQTYGKRENPAILLVMGMGGQHILWPAEMVEGLVKESFYVITFDHRDAGQSISYDFDKDPYNLMDMVKDGIGVLDHLVVPKAHVVGLSMGGPIAELMSVYHPDRVASITLIATSADFRPLHLAFDGLPPEQGLLSSPTEEYNECRNRFLVAAPNSDEWVARRVDLWRVLEGSMPFDEDFYHKLFSDYLSRQKNPATLTNYVRATKASENLIRTVPFQVTVPTLILHGSEDPIFPSDHGLALASAIAHSGYLQIFGMGHLPNRHFAAMLVEAIKKHTLCPAK
ncbi:MAG: alpha/beta hydrolase [Chlamydiales bacterium]|nr:alpha/beta hydrolase [Chlamydiales bacterium]